MHKFITFFFLFCCCLSADSGSQKTVGIFTYRVQAMQPWDPDSVKRGITGSEEAVIYISEELAKLGNKVIVFANPPENSVHSLESANPRYVSVDFNDGRILDSAISWRMPCAAEWLKQRAKKIYFWPHDTCSISVKEEEINGFNDVLWLSEWQRQQWISVNPGFAKFTQVFGNGVKPERCQTLLKRENPHACIYGSNYGRGLEILLDIWPTIKQQFPDASLDIYYGWEHWGLLSPEKEAKMRAQVQNLAGLDVYDHGLVGHEELSRAYERASLWTYPCMGIETFCITALRAQLAGALPVIIEGSALKETVRYGFRCCGPDGYLEELAKAMCYAEKMSVEERGKMGEFILEEYTWERVAMKWNRLFSSF